MLYLDVSRTLSRINRPVPTGIDRVELAYIQHVLEHFRDEVRFIAISGQRTMLISNSFMRKVTSHLLKTWSRAKQARGGDADKVANFLGWDRTADTVLPAPTQSPRKRAAPLQNPLRKTPFTFFKQRFDHWKLLRAAASQNSKSVYLNVSHHHLEKEHLLSELLEFLNAEMVVFIHDAIPVHFPQYSNEGDADKHLRRLKTVAKLASRVIVNSRTTIDQIMPIMLDGKIVESEICINPLWVDESFTAQVETLATSPPHSSTRAFFLCVGTIEPRKNHMMLLRAWRELVEEMGDEAPLLLIVGQRGWGVEDTLAMLDDCEDLKRHILECNELSDTDLAEVLWSATAVLLPSFSEGFGLPLIEALSFGKTVFASDIPAYREVGGDNPVFLDPNDIPAWKREIQNHAREYGTRVSPSQVSPLDFSAFNRDIHLKKSFDLIARDQ